MAAEQLSKFSTRPIVLLTGIGISTLGDFIYLVAINLLVLNMTGSAAAVAGLWVMGPIAALVTKFWAGSFIDRFEKRRLMIGADLFRAIIVAVIPFLHSVWPIYVGLFFLAVAKSFFMPAMTSYITLLISKERRKKFNAFQSLISSSAFLVGPSIAGGLLLISTPKTAIWINAVSFLISAMLLGFLPRLDPKDGTANANSTRFSLNLLKIDWQTVYQFCREQPFIFGVYAVAQFGILMATGMDAQEVVFIRKVIGLPAADYGILISLTGIGSVVGSLTISFFSKKLSIRAMIGIGFIMVATGYLIYSFSFSFLSVAIGFILLGYFNSFSGTGWITFFQNNVPSGMIGRVSSIFGTFLSVFQIFFIMLIGLTGDVFPLRYSIITASFIFLACSLFLIAIIYQPSKKWYFSEEDTA